MKTLNQTIEFHRRDSKRMKLEIEKLTDKCALLKYQLDEEKFVTRGLQREIDRLKKFIREKVQV